MKNYLRFGEIPECGKSINFFKMTNSQNETFTYYLNIGEIGLAFGSVPSDAFENGLSVFELDEYGMPVLTNLQLVSSLLARINKVAYIVTGEEIQKGNDGEPLIKLEKIENSKEFDKNALIDYALSVLQSNFEMQEYNEEENYGSNELFHFFAEYKINKKTGEKVSRWTETKGNDWELLPGVDEYVLNGWTFSNPVDGFEVKLGMQEEN